MKTVLVTVGAIMYFSAIGQCNCEENLSQLRMMIATDYPGYLDKTTNSNYNLFADSLFTESRKISDEYNCYLILRSLANFFKDPHLLVTINNVPQNQGKIRSIFSTIRPPFLGNSINVFNNKSLPIEGIWEARNQGADYTVQIHKNNFGQYIGSIVGADEIFWHPGQVKFIINSRKDNLYRITFFLRDHTPVKVNAIYDSIGIIDMKAYGIWQNVSSRKNNQSKIDSVLKSKLTIYLKAVDSNTTYLRIPSFSASNLNQFDSLIKSNNDQLLKKTLIIDLRSNGGGSTIVSSVLLKYIYDRPIVYQGSSFLNSEKNREDLIKIFAKPEYKNSYEELIKEKLDLIQSSPINTWVPFSQLKTEKLDSVYPLPKQVFILVDRFSASATEYFLMEARQSSKVKIVGQNTRGAVDYTDIGLPRILLDSLFYLQIPMIRNDRLETTKLDNIGIKPDISVPEDEDALVFLLNHLKNE